jgi:acetyltransferase-like isoleucine patch superfamily enzyme
MTDLREYTGDWDYGLLPTNVQVGEGCWIERLDSFGRMLSTRDPAVVLGNRVHVFTWTAFSLERNATLSVGDDSVLVGTQFMCAEQITIGQRVVISYHCVVADSDFHPRTAQARREDAVASAPDGDHSKRPPVESEPVVIEDDVWVGIGAMILKGVRIGAGARVAAGAIVSRDVAPGSLVAGSPAEPVL